MVPPRKHKILKNNLNNFLNFQKNPKNPLSRCSMNCWQLASFPIWRSWPGAWTWACWTGPAGSPPSGNNSSSGSSGAPRDRSLDDDHWILIIKLIFGHLIIDFWYLISFDHAADLWSLLFDRWALIFMLFIDDFSLYLINDLVHLWSFTFWNVISDILKRFRQIFI